MDRRTTARLIAVLALAGAACQSMTAAQAASDDKVPSKAAAAVVHLRATVQKEWERERERLGAAELKAIEKLAHDIRAHPGQLFVTWSSFGTVHQLWSPFVELDAGSAPIDTAHDFLKSHHHLFGIDTGSLALAGASEVRRPDGTAFVRFEQRTKQGTPVFAAEVHVHIGRRGGIRSITANVVPESFLPSSDPQLSAEAAMAFAGKGATSAIVGYYNLSNDVRLVWRVHVVNPPERFVFIDDTTGKSLLESPLSAEDAARQIFYCDACGDIQLPGLLQYSDKCIVTGTRDPAECLAPGLVCVDVLLGPCVKARDEPMSGTSKAVRENLKDVEDFFSSILFRDGWNNRPRSALHRTRASSDADRATGGVNVECGAEWKFSTSSIAPAQMAIGANRACRDVIAHEYLHAVFDARGGLAPSGCAQSMPIQEGFGDVFGELIEKHYVGSADWRHGTRCRDCSHRGINGPSLSEPATTPQRCSLGSFAPCPGPALLETRATAPPESWTFFRAECRGDFNSSIVGKLGYLMGRDPADGAYAHGGLSVTGIGAPAAGVWYETQETRLSPASTHTDLRVALLDACAWYAPATAADCANAVESIGVWSPDLIEDIVIDPRTIEVFPEDARVRLSAAMGDRPGESYSFFFKFTPTATDPLRGDLMFQRRPCTLLDECPWEPPLVWRRAVVAISDRIRPHTPAVVRRSPGKDGDELWVCYRDIGFSCDFIDDRGIHRGPSLRTYVIDDEVFALDIVGDLSAAHLDGTIYVAFRNSSRDVMLASYRIGDPAGFSAPRQLRLDTGPLIESAVAPVLAAGVIDDDGQRALLVAYVDYRPQDLFVRRVNVTSARVEGVWLPQRGPDPLFTRVRPALAIFHNRVHIAIFEARLGFRGFDPLERNSLSIVTNNAPPIVLDRPSPMVVQPGFFLSGFSLYEGVGGALHFIHTSPGDDRVARRFKMSR